MADNLTVVGDKIIGDVISGWNEKLTLTNAELALMVPFVELFAILSQSESDASHASQQQYNNDAFTVNIKDDQNSKPETIKLLPLFSLKNQQAQVDKDTHRLTYNRGIPGINSLKVEYLSPEMGGYRVVLEAAIPILSDETIKNNNLRRLIITDSEWLILYGWSKTKTGIVDLFDNATDRVINLSNAKKGYYKILRTVLTSFNFEARSNKEVMITCTFGSPLVNKLSMTTLTRYKDIIKNYLDSNSINTLITDVDEKKTLPTDISISGFSSIIKKSESGAKQQIKSNIQEYYYLGWILEAIRVASITDRDDKSIEFKKINFRKFNHTKQIVVDISEEGLRKTIPLNVDYPAFIPIPREVFNLVMNNLTNDSLLMIFAKFLRAASNLIADGYLVGVINNSSGNIMEVKELNESIHEFVSKSRNNDSLQFKVAMAQSNSLVEHVSFNGNIPKELMYGIDTIIDTDNGLATLYNTSIDILNDELNSKKKTLSPLAKLVQGFLNSNKKMGRDKITDIEAQQFKLTKFRKHINAKQDQTQIFTEILSGTNVPIGYAIRNYFNTLVLKIHGTTSIPAFMSLYFSGFLKGIDGIYMVNTSTDDVDVGDFSTILQCKLLEPF